MTIGSGIVVYDHPPFQAILTPVAGGWDVIVGRELVGGGWLGQNLGTVRKIHRAARLAIREAVEQHAAYNEEHRR